MPINLKIELRQDLMCKAVEYWLEKKVFRFPCRVSKMVESRVNKTSTFAVEVKEATEERPGEQEKSLIFPPKPYYDG